MSRHLRRSFLPVLAFALTVALLSSPALGQKKKKKKDKDTRNEGIALLWTPTTEMSELGSINLTGISNVKIEVQAFNDAREEGEEIGRNIEDDDPKLVTTPDDIASFVTEHFRDTLDNLGFTTVDSGGDVVLNADIRRFYVEEEDTYEGDVSLKVSITKGGKEVYAGIAGGSTTRWGRSYKDENYYETLADSLIDLVYDLASSDGFREALGG